MSGADETPIHDLARIAARVVADFRAAPAAVVAAAVRRGDAFEFGAGAAGRLGEDDPRETRIDTPFDLASVTKSVVALAFARLERAGILCRAELLGAVLPELAGSASGHIALDLFAAHRSGLEAHRALFAPLLTGGVVDRAAALREVAEARREGCEGEPPEGGFAPLYSDLGYLLLGEAIARRAGIALDAVVEREVAAPLGLSIHSARAWEKLDADRFARVAPTEAAAFRGGVVRGRVHDENAFAIGADAMCGHAGLFGEALSVVRLGVAVLDALAGRSDWLGPRDLAPLVRKRPGGSLLAGFDGKSAEAPSSGARFGPNTFGHLGFTGTSLWIDPDAELVGVLLTNRVHPTREHIAIRTARPVIYDAIFDAMIRP